MTTKRPMIPALLIDCEKNSSYRHINARFIWIDELNDKNGKHCSQSGEIVYPSSYGETKNYDNLFIWSQAGKNDSGFYGFGVVYRQCYSVDLRDAKSMFKTLDMIEKKSQKYFDEFGRFTSISEYIFGIAKALKIKYFVFRRYDDNELGYREYETNAHGLDKLRSYEKEQLPKKE